MNRIELFKGKGLQPWFYRLVSSNGQTLTVSEGYFSHWNARRGATKTAKSLGLELRDLTKRPYRKFG